MALMKFREQNQVKWMGSRPGHNGTQVVEYGTADNSDDIIYAVPAGKTFFLCTATLGYEFIAAGVALLRIRTDTAATYYNLVCDYAQAALFGRSRSVTFWPPMELPAGYDIYLFSGAVGLTLNGQIFGWVE